MLKAWIEDHYRDFEQDPQLTEDFLSFVNGELTELMASSASQLGKIFEKQKDAAAKDKEEKEASLRDQKEREEEGAGVGAQVSLENWLAIDTQLLAEHMTLLESQYYCAITPKEVSLSHAHSLTHELSHTHTYTHICTCSQRDHHTVHTYPHTHTYKPSSLTSSLIFPTVYCLE